MLRVERSGIEGGPTSDSVMPMIKMRMSMLSRGDTRMSMRHERCVKGSRLFEVNLIWSKVSLNELDAANTIKVTALTAICCPSRSLARFQQPRYLCSTHLSSRSSTTRHTTTLISGYTLINLFKPIFPAMYVTNMILSSLTP